MQARLAAFACFVAILALPAPSQASGFTGVSARLAELVEYTQIPLASLSPDGRHAAYITLRADVRTDAYIIEVKVADTRGAAAPSEVSRYQLSADQTVDTARFLLPSAADVRWINNERFALIERVGSRMQLAIWDLVSRTKRALGEPHDEIRLQNAPDRPGALLVITGDFLTPPDRHGLARDHGWRMEDSYSFFGPFRNPTSGPWARTQHWLLEDGRLSRWSGEPDSEGWAVTPAAFGRYSGVQVGDTQVVAYGHTASPDGAIIAAIEMNRSGIGSDRLEATTNVVFVSADGSEARTARTRPIILSLLLGWETSSAGVYYLDIGARNTSLRLAMTDGAVRDILISHSQLMTPCRPPQACGVISADTGQVLLVQSTNSTPDTLVLVDLEDGSVRTLDAPNADFGRRHRQEPRFIEMTGMRSDVWGRLYLPPNHRRGRRYPLVITQYVSWPGFALAVGEEVPLHELTASGVAVFAMHSFGLNFTGIAERANPGELDRLEQPLVGMRDIVRRLAAEGIVDPDRVGVWGLSYGAEIASYAAWRWPELAAVSAATAGGWDPSLRYLGGVNYSGDLRSRGFASVSEPQDIEAWRRFSLGLNAHPGLAPILFQSPDEEQHFTSATWTQLRLAGAPAEWYEYANEGHVKRSPATRWWVFRRNLDWFRFWLQDYEDPESGLEQQYVHWRGLRSAQCSQVQRVYCPANQSGEGGLDQRVRRYVGP